MVTWTCPKCGKHNIRFMVGIIIAAPMKYYMGLSKKNIAKKEVEIWGASWPTMDIYCMDCGNNLFFAREKAALYIYQDVLEKIAQGESKDIIADVKLALQRAKEITDQRVKETFQQENIEKPFGDW